MVNYFSHVCTDRVRRAHSVGECILCLHAAKLSNERVYALTLNAHTLSQRPSSSSKPIAAFLSTTRAGQGQNTLRNAPCPPPLPPQQQSLPPTSSTPSPDTLRSPPQPAAPNVPHAPGCLLARCRPVHCLRSTASLSAATRPTSFYMASKSCPLQSGPLPTASRPAAVRPTSCRPAAVKPASFRLATVRPTSLKFLPACCRPAATIRTGPLPTGPLPACCSPNHFKFLHTRRRQVHYPLRPCPLQCAVCRPAAARPTVSHPTFSLPAAVSPTACLPTVFLPAASFPAAAWPTSSESVPAAVRPTDPLTAGSLQPSGRPKDWFRREGPGQ